MNLQPFFENKLYQAVKKHGVDVVANKLNVKPKDILNTLILERGKIDRIYYAEKCLKIQNKEGMLVPLIATKGQKKLQAVIDRQRSEGRPVRIKMPKTRRFGGSTWTQSVFYGDVQYGEHMQCLTVCHDLDASVNMRAMFERFNTYYTLSKLNPKKETPKRWRFQQKDIDYLIDTAVELDTGRSFTPHRLHGSEVAFYKDTETLMTGLLRSVPYTSNSLVILESTANGAGGWWYDFVTSENDYELVFVGWNEMTENVRPFTNEKEMIELEKSLSQYERRIRDSYDLTLEQLNWRRWSIKNETNNDEDKFTQENPINVEESFLLSGRPYFPITVVKQNIARVKNLATLKTGYLEWDKYGESVIFSDNDSGFWKEYELPDVATENLYLCGIDPSEGKANAENKNPDYSVITIFNRKTKKVSARFRGRVDTDALEVEIHKAYIRWNCCLAIPEKNNTAGGAIIKGLKQIDGITLYQKELEGRVDDGETVEYGYNTNKNTREILLSDLRRAIKEGEYKDDDIEFWNEAGVFIIDKTGKAIAMPNKHDDIIFSSGLCLQGESQALPINRPKQEEAKIYYLPDVDLRESTDKEIDYAEF